LEFPIDGEYDFAYVAANSDCVGDPISDGIGRWATTRFGASQEEATAGASQEEAGAGALQEEVGVGAERPPDLEFPIDGEYDFAYVAANPEGLSEVGACQEEATAGASHRVAGAGALREELPSQEEVNGCLGCCAKRPPLAALEFPIDGEYDFAYVAANPVDPVIDCIGLWAT
jgi:hypothetical protein